MLYSKFIFDLPKLDDVIHLYLPRTHLYWMGNIYTYEESSSTPIDETVLNNLREFKKP